MPLRDMDREQMWLLPPSLDELLPLDHPARFVAVFVDALDQEGWAELGVEINGDPLGAPAFHPRALLCVWLYGFMTGVRSCCKLEAACRDQIPYLWLTGWQHPDHNTLWRFYKEHRQAMRSLFKRTVRTAVAMQLVDLAVQAVDGTKVAANATRWSSTAMWMPSGWLRGSIYWVLLVRGRFCVSETIIPEHRSTFLTPSARRDTHLFGGLGINQRFPCKLAGKW